MPHVETSSFVQQCASEFLQRFPQFEHCAVFTRFEPEKPAGEFRVEAPPEHCSRFRSSLSYSVNDKAVNVSWDGCGECMVIIPGLRDGPKAQREGLSLFGEIVSEDRVSLSYWRRGVCIQAAFVATKEARAVIGLPDPEGLVRRVRSWSGTFDYDEVAQNH
jgi:hypothetical protein